jgi:hypothetical protein
LVAVAVLPLSEGVARADPDLRLIRQTDLDRVPALRPDWPVPRDGGQVFYIQRSPNSNTVVYAARFAEDGNLDPDRPLVAYWRRYNTDGAPRALTYVENRFAYGVRTRADETGRYDVRLRALPDLQLFLVQTGPGAADLRLPRGAEDLSLIYAFLEVDESGLLPAVTRITLIGRAVQSGGILQLDYAVNGGEFEENQ